jgi:hypothetical protein
MKTLLIVAVASTEKVSPKVWPKRLWQDDAGFVVSLELVLLATVIVLGLIVGMSAYRDAMVSEIADSAAAVSSLNQTFQYDEVALSGTFGSIAYDARTDGSLFRDQLDFCESAAGDPSGAMAMCIVVDAVTIEQE